MLALGIIIGILVSFIVFGTTLFFRKELSKSLDKIQKREKAIVIDTYDVLDEFDDNTPPRQ